MPKNPMLIKERLAFPSLKKSYSKLNEIEKDKVDRILSHYKNNQDVYEKCFPKTMINGRSFILVNTLHIPTIRNFIQQYYEKKSSTYTKEKKEVIKGYCLFVHATKFHEKHISVITDSLKQLSYEEARDLLIEELQIPGVRPVKRKNQRYLEFSLRTPLSHFLKVMEKQIAKNVLTKTPYDESKEKRPIKPLSPLPEPDLSLVSVGNAYSWMDGNASKKMMHPSMGRKKKNRKKKKGNSSKHS